MMLYIVYRELENGARDRLFITNIKELADGCQAHYEALGVEGVKIEEEEVRKC